MAGSVSVWSFWTARTGGWLRAASYTYEEEEEEGGERGDWEEEEEEEEEEGRPGRAECCPTTRCWTLAGADAEAPVTDRLPKHRSFPHLVMWEQ